MLTGKAIIRAVSQGRIRIEPFRCLQVNPNSYNFRLGDRLLAMTTPGEEPDPFLIPPGGYVLIPGVVYLGMTEELIGSSHFAMTLLGRSSLGRLGLFVNITADLGHVGSFSHWTLELTVVQPLRVYSAMLLGQVVFWPVEGARQHYGGRYAHHTSPTPCLDRTLCLSLAEESI
ncbi:MAG: deoxycytidine deaminase [Candidatus Solibacter sp.]|nr:deoxycytidine deaminase [Candidatus Solibacter sp.]